MSTIYLIYSQLVSELKQNGKLMDQLPHSLGSPLKIPVILIDSIINQTLKNGLFLDLLFMTVT